MLTHENRPQDGRVPIRPTRTTWLRAARRFGRSTTTEIKFNGQPIALVVAEDWETARFAATLVRVEYEAEPTPPICTQRLDKAYVVEKPDKPRGDAAKAYAAAAVRHEAEYFIPTEHHNPMELFAATVIWNGDGKLTVYDKTQGVQNVQRYVCSVFGLGADDVRVMSPFVGGAFGSGLRPQYEVVLAVQAALKLKRSVRLVLTREQMYGLGYRPATIERIALGAKADGTLDAITHEAIAVTSQYEEFSPQRYRHGRRSSTRAPTRNMSTSSLRLDRADAVPTCARRARRPASMRSNAQWTSSPSRSKLDPMELRLRCYSDRDQNQDVPYTSKQLRECYRQGAEAFGWAKRNPEPRSMRDGTELVGWGMATGVWEALQMPMAARIVLTGNGHAEVSCATSDIGTGTYTIMAQVAADMLGVPIENVTVKLGDSTLPHVAGRGRIVDRGLGGARHRGRRR